MANLKILGFQNPEFNILADIKILAYQNPEFKILADLKILAEFKVLGFQTKIARFSPISRFDHSKISEF